MKHPAIGDPNPPDRGPSNDGYLTKLYRESKRMVREAVPEDLAPRRLGVL